DPCCRPLIRAKHSMLPSGWILKQQIAGLQEEFKRNESCWHAAYGKLRDQVEMLTRQNMELRDELSVSGHQKQKAEKNPKAVNFMDRKSEILVLEDIICLILSGKCRSSFSLELAFKWFRLEFKSQKSSLTGSFNSLCIQGWKICAFKEGSISSYVCQGD
uniref:Ig-like domain-containing protein n=1 Tax=Falco tinnunculus TaxID=100819 RepID=A0A8C4VCS4_FALTI